MSDPTIQGFSGPNGISPYGQSGSQPAVVPNNNTDVSVYGTEIVKDEQPVSQSSNRSVDITGFRTYFGGKAHTLYQNELSDLKVSITRQQKLILAAGGIPPELPSFEDYSPNKKGAKSYVEALRDHNFALGYELQIAQTQDVNSSIRGAANEIMIQNDMNTMGLHGHIFAEGQQTRDEGFNQYADLKGDIEKVDQNVDEEGAATRGAVNAAAKKTVGAVQKSHQVLKATVIGESRSVKNTVKDGTRQVINNNNEQTKILDPSGIKRGLHEVDEWIFGD